MLTSSVAGPAVAAERPVAVVRCDDPVRWDAYVNGASGASLYHLWAWGAVNRDEFGHATFPLAALDGDRIVGILPVVKVKTLLFGTLGCSMPFVNYGGPVADSPAVEAALVEAARELARRERMKYLEIRSLHRLDERIPALTHKVSMTVDLSPGADALWNAFKSSHRQQIRKAEKEGFTTRHGGRELIPDFYAVMSESWRSLGTPFYRRRYFERLFEQVGDRFWLTVVYDGARPAATQMGGLFNGTVEGLWLGMRDEFRARYVGYTLYWELLKWGAEHGHHTFHLGRSTADSGAESFKKKWNAHATQLYWHYLLEPGRPMPGLSVDNPKYQRAIETWRKLPLGLTQVLGPHIARGIP
jgi:FemAB-related protein (PEP-CTERM system-associated)